MKHIKTFESFNNQSIETQEEINEFLGGKLRRAVSEYEEVHADTLAKIVKYDKELNPDYIELTKKLKDSLARENSALAKKHGVNPNELYKKLDQIAIPTDIATFKTKVSQGGSGMAQFAAGASGGRQKLTGQ